MKEYKNYNGLCSRKNGEIVNVNLRFADKNIIVENTMSFLGRKAMKMIVDCSFVIKDYQVEAKLKGKTVVIYGAGQDANSFYEKYNSWLKIDCCMAKEASKNIEHLNIFKVENILSNLDNRKIIICSRMYSFEMKKNLEKYGLIAGEDFWIWDPDYTDSVKAFVEYNKCTIAPVKGENVILIPIEGCHDGTTIIYRYFVTFLAQKTNSRIVGYIRQGGNRFESIIYPSVIDIYKSFGMEEIVELPKTGYIEENISTIYNEIVSEIHDMDDWNDISIDGLKCGVSFLRTYLRKYDLDFNPTNADACECLADVIKNVLFWKDYFKENKVASVVLWDGVHNESFLRDIAIENGAKTYIIHPLGTHRTCTNFNFGENFANLKDFYEALSDEEKKVGVEWAKTAIEKMLRGQSGAYLTYRDDNNNVFRFKTGKLNLPQKNKLRVLICPHMFDEDQWYNGEQLCGNNFLSWFLFLGEIIDTTDYEWYIKLHPDETERGNRLVMEYLTMHSKLNLLPSNVSPMDLKNADFDYALTISGSIGHEYPFLGMNVVNAGNNPHISFGFNISPKTREEYREILLNLEKYSVLDKKEDIYKYYCVNYLYNKGNDFSEEIRSVFDYIDFYKRDRDNSIYKAYLSNITPQNEEQIQKMVVQVIDSLDTWKPGVFYKKSEETIRQLLDSVK